MTEVLPRQQVTETLFFPAAAGYGALAVPLSIHGQFGGVTPPGLSFPAGHAHELFFGYALAVVAGFLINRLSTFTLLALFTAWLAARASFLWFPGSLAALVANTAFALAIAMIAAPRFMKAAKKWRNRIIGPLVLAICAAAVALQLALTAGFTPAAWATTRTAVLLFALLMLFFGGRLIAPAAAGAIEKAGGQLEARVQPRIEGALIVLLAAAMLFSFWPVLRSAAGALLLLAGALALVRLARWRLWQCAWRIDLICLGVGYAWLGLGLALFGLVQLELIDTRENVIVHAITIGALGTLTTNVMLRTRLVRLRIAPNGLWPVPVLMTLLMSLATTLRIVWPDQPSTLMAAAACWSLSALILLGCLLGRTIHPSSRSTSSAR